MWGKDFNIADISIGRNSYWLKVIGRADYIGSFEQRTLATINASWKVQPDFCSKVIDTFDPNLTFIQ